jgi:hypothetical protein
MANARPPKGATAQWVSGCDLSNSASLQISVKQLSSIPVEQAVSNPDAHGASLAALHVLAAAVFIFAADPRPEAE